VVRSIESSRHDLDRIEAERRGINRGGSRKSLGNQAEIVPACADVYAFFELKNRPNEKREEILGGHENLLLWSAALIQLSNQNLS